jgi:quinol monooxygenase YgiN
MIIGRFSVKCRPERVEEVAAAMVAVEAPSRDIAGVVHFDVVRSLTDPDTLLAVEVFEDHTAFDQQNAQPEVAALLSLIEAGAAVGSYHWARWDCTAS